jgi:hypothetical protein
MMPSPLPPAYVASTSPGSSTSFPEPSAPPAYSELPQSVEGAGFQPVSKPPQFQSSFGSSHLSSSSTSSQTYRPELVSFVYRDAEPSISTISYRPQSHWFGNSCKVFLALLGWTAFALSIVFAPPIFGLAVALSVFAAYISVVLTAYAGWDADTAVQVALFIPVIALWLIANSNGGGRHCRHRCH